MAGLQRRHNKWRAKVRIPQGLQEKYDGRKYLQKTMTALDRPTAKLEASAWELKLRTEWAAMNGDGGTNRVALRNLYVQLLKDAEGGTFTMPDDPEAFDEVTAGIDYELEKIADRYEDKPLPEAERVKVLALQDAMRSRKGEEVPRRKELEPTFRDLADDHLKLWKTQHGLKETNTEQQKKATFDLFASYWGSRPIRDVRKKDAATFIDALSQLDPLWAKSPKAKKMSWAELLKEYGGRQRGLSDRTINRHFATLKSLWRWAQERDYCEGNNPFDGFHKRLKGGRNAKGYQPWGRDELKHLFTPPPKRQDVTEIMLVAMFTGMRLDEIASLKRGQIKVEDGVTFVDIEDAKTTAGIRSVPLHSRLSWLAARREGKPEERIWPRFNPEGPGKKAGQDASKEFSRFKLSKGFDSRAKVFHSFRKNFVGQLEQAGVPQNEVAQLVGHEKDGLTFGVYGSKMTLQRGAEIVELVRYDDLPLPEPT